MTKLMLGYSHIVSRIHRFAGVDGKEKRILSELLQETFKTGIQRVTSKKHKECIVFVSSGH